MGFEKTLDLYKTSKDFTVVFDYKCDIEIHLEDNFEFYQLKPVMIILHIRWQNLSKDKAGNSILGKLYTLKYAEDNDEVDKVVVAVVSNAPINDGKRFTIIVNLFYLLVWMRKQLKSEGSSERRIIKRWRVETWKYILY